VTEEDDDLSSLAESVSSTSSRLFHIIQNYAMIVKWLANTACMIVLLLVWLYSITKPSQHEEARYDKQNTILHNAECDNKDESNMLSS
jgi:Na+-transporting NADH:ubiquinone oxidoreductase subunit NqrC